MTNAIAAHLLALPAWVALLFVFALPALESSAFVGFVFPGEIALVLGGVVAYDGRVALAAVLTAGIAGAIVGDSVGYAIGRRYGRRLLDGTVGRFVNSRHLDRAETYLAERGGRAVFFGRFTAALRVMIPGLAGMSGLRYRTFLLYNISSGIVWVTLSVLLGYLGGSSWRHVEHVASRVGLVVLGLVVLGLVVAYGLRRVGSERFSRLVSAARVRFPRAAGWIFARLDPALTHGLGLTVAVVFAVAATWTFLGISQDVRAHEELALLDPHVLGWVLAHRSAGLDVFFEIVTWLGATAVTVPLLVVAGGFLAWRRRTWVPAIDLTVVYAVVVLLSAVTGRLVDRHRPQTADWLVPASGWTYPSGHAAQAFAAWGILALVAASRASARTRVRAAAASAVVAVLVATGQVYLGVNWATDVLGGAALAVAVLALRSVVHQWPPAPGSGISAPSRSA
jgi:membrane protein DedA with SNARE-associated domain/membrane-associated phospholipid phosphatase